MKTGPDIVTDGLVFGYDTGYPSADNETSLRFNKGEPVTNLFTTVGNASNVDQNVTFSVNGTGTFKRVAVGTEIGNYKVKETDVVYSYALGGNGCHYHGNDYSSVSSGTKVSFSIEYFLTSDVSIVSNYLGNFEQLSGVGGSWGSVNSQTGVWHKVSFTRTATSTGNLRMLMYPGACSGTHLSAQGTIYYKNPTVTLTEHNVPFVSGTRSSTQSLIDLKKTTDIDLSNVSFDSNAQITFDGTDDRIDTALYHLSGSDHTEEVVVYRGSAGTQQGMLCDLQYGFYGLLFLSSDKIRYRQMQQLSNPTSYPNVSVDTPDTYGVGTYHIVGSFSSANGFRLYVNGELKNSNSTDLPFNLSGNRGINHIGLYKASNSSTYHNHLDGKLHIVKCYDKELTAAQVKQNYNAYKNRFGI